MDVLSPETPIRLLRWHSRQAKAREIKAEMNRPIRNFHDPAHIRHENYSNSVYHPRVNLNLRDFHNILCDLITQTIAEDIEALNILSPLARDASHHPEFLLHRFPKEQATSMEDPSNVGSFEAPSKGKKMSFLNVPSTPEMGSVQYSTSGCHCTSSLKYITEDLGEDRAPRLLTLMIRSEKHFALPRDGDR